MFVFGILRNLYTLVTRNVTDPDEISHVDLIVLWKLLVKSTNIETLFSSSHVNKSLLYLFKGLKGLFFRSLTANIAINDRES